jgi:hypothetical protein
VDFNGEIDRLLVDQAGRVSVVTTRSAGLTAVTAVAAALISADISAKIEVRFGVVTVLGLATIAGIIVLLGTPLEGGPDLDKLLEWDRLRPTQFSELVHTAKVIAVVANKERVRFVDITFYIQAILVGIAVIVALASVRSG